MHFLYLNLYKVQFFSAHFQGLLRRRRVFSRGLRGGARKRAAGALRCKLGPPPGSVARALDVHSRARWLFFKRLRSGLLGQLGPCKLPKLILLFFHHLFVLFFALQLFLMYQNSPQRLGSRGTTATALQVFPFEAVTNGASVCFCVFACAITDPTEKGISNTVSRTDVQFHSFCCAVLCCLRLLLCTCITP